MTPDQVLLEEARVNYAWRCALDEQERALRAPRRPWWWWLALSFAIGLTLAEVWIAYRVFAGWPLGVPLLTRLAG